MFLSIVIPAYNAAKTIQPCLESIRASRFHNFEIIVVDDGSADETAALAEKIAHRVIRHGRNRSRIEARESGLRAATGDVILFIDADVLIQTDTLEKIASTFETVPDVSACTGLLSKTHPNEDFFSQYKNLYMHFIFKRLPERVSFLFGSIFAVRRGLLNEMAAGYEKGEDTALGQELARQGRAIAFLKDLQVIHLKSYTFRSWLKNDFEIPCHWGRLFMDQQGWKQLGRNKVGFAHSPREQIASLFVAPLALISWTATLSGGLPLAFPLSLTILWLLLNAPFLFFLSKEKGALFGIESVPVTYLDHLIMLSGVIAGFISFFARGVHKTFHRKPLAVRK